MAAHYELADPKENEVVDSIKYSLGRVKYNLSRKTLNNYNQRDLRRMFTELDSVIEVYNIAQTMNKARYIQC